MSLFQLQREGNVDALREFATHSANAAVRHRAAELLGEFEADDEIVETLIDLVQNDEDEDVRAAAVTALDELGERPLERLVATLADVDRQSDDTAWRVDDRYESFLEAEQPELRLAATAVLGQRGGADTVQPVVTRLEDDDERVRSRAARACGRIGDPRTEAALADALADDAPTVRREAAVSLGSVAGGRGIAALRDALDDPNDAVRRAAVAALGDLGRPATLPDVVDVLADSSTIVRRAAAFALVDLLATAPAEQSHGARELIVDELGAVEQPDVIVEVLTDVLDRASEARYRHNVAWLLGRIVSDPSRAVIDAMVRALDDDDRTVARFAATSLASFDDPAVESALVDTVSDPSESGHSREMAAFTLGKIGSEDARESLSAVVETADDESVRERAMTALAKLGGKP